MRSSPALLDVFRPYVVSGRTAEHQRWTSSPPHDRGVDRSRRPYWHHNVTPDRHRPGNPSLAWGVRHRIVNISVDYLEIEE